MRRARRRPGRGTRRHPSGPRAVRVSVLVVSRVGLPRGLVAWPHRCCSCWPADAGFARKRLRRRARHATMRTATGMHWRRSKTNAFRAGSRRLARQQRSCRRGGSWGRTSNRRFRRKWPCGPRSAPPSSPTQTGGPTLRAGFEESSRWLWAGRSLRRAPVECVPLNATRPPLTAQDHDAPLVLFVAIRALQSDRQDGGGGSGAGGVAARSWCLRTVQQDGREHRHSPR